MSTGSPESADRRPRDRTRARDAGAAEVARRLGKLLASGLVAALVLLHGKLLWQRIADLTLFEPWVALRWGIAIAVFAGFVGLQRAGVSVIWGHRALILWLLVLLCHAGTLSPAEVPRPLAEPGVLLTIALWGFALRAILGDRRLAAAPLARRAHVAERTTAPPHGPDLLEPLSPRPPPAG